MAKRDYYEVLGVHKNAADTEIKKVFRRLAMECHPDKNPGDAKAEARFKELAEAYEVLSDGTRRAEYDLYGHREGGPGFQTRGFDFGNNVDDLFQEIFGDIFGQGQRRGTRAERGSDLRYDLTLEFSEAVFGCTREISFPASRPCETCEGTGAQPGTSPTPCPRCRGHGRVRTQQGFFAVERPCPGCRGTGRIIEAPCTSCSGTGQVRTRQRLQVHISPGVDTGTRLRMAGEGEAGPNGGPPGDLFIILSVKDHPFFRRHGEDIVCEVPISMAQAALGADLEVPTLDGSAKIRVPPGTQHDTELALKGKGVPRDARHRGRQRVILQVEIPTRLTPRQRELLEEFETLREEQGDSTLGRLWGKVRKSFG